MSTIDDKPKGKAGRPLGATNKLARDSIERAQATGMLPHEILLDMARGNPQKEYDVLPDGKTTERWVSLDVEQRKDAAKAAAPYYAPKISTVEVIRNVEDAELDWLIAELTAQTSTASSTDGEAEEDEAEGRPRGSSTNADTAACHVVRRKLVED